MTDSLSKAEQEKLDHALRLLLQKGSNNPFFNYQVRTRNDSLKSYGVLIRTTDPSALAASDLAIGDGSSKVITGHLTIEEIRRAVQMKSVISISNPSEAKLH